MTVATVAVAAGAGGGPGGRPRPFHAYRVAVSFQRDVLGVVCPEPRCLAPAGVLCATGSRRGWHIPRATRALEVEFGDLGGGVDGVDDEPLRSRGRRGRSKRVAA